MYCPYCGLKLDDGMTICPACGESQVFEEDLEDSIDTELPQADSGREGGTDPANIQDLLHLPEEISLTTETEGQRRSTAKQRGSHRGGKRLAPSSQSLFSGISLPTGGRRGAGGRPAAKEPTKQGKENNQAPVMKELLGFVNALSKYFRGILRFGVRRLIIASLGAILVIVLIGLLIGGISARNVRRIVAVTSEDLVLLQGEESHTLELNFLEDSVASAAGGKTAAALTQLSGAAMTRRGVIGYLDDYVVPTDSWTLKLHDLRRPEVEHRIDAGVYSEGIPGVCGHAGELTAEWKMSEDGSAIFYLKDMVEQGADLYRYASGSARKVAAKVTAFDISPDGKRALWVSLDDNGEANILTIQDFSEKDGPRQLDTEYSRLAGYDKYFEAVFYLRDGGDGVNPISLYAAGFEREKERLLPGLSYMTKTGDDGSFFYIAADASSGKNLYYYNSAGEILLVTRSCSDIPFCDPERGYAVYCSESVDARTYFLYCGGTSMEFGNRWVVDTAENGKGNILYLILFEEGSGRGLYRCQISKSGEAGMPEKLAEDCSELLYDEKSDTLFYAIDSAAGFNRSSLYCWDGKESHLLGDNAYPLVVYGGKNRWAFFTEVEADAYSDAAPHRLVGTLNEYSGDNVTEIDSNVSLLFWHYEGDGALIYIKDYYDAFGGSLYLYKSGTATRLAADAQAVLMEEAFRGAFGR